LQMEPVRPTLQKLLADILNRFPAEQVPLETWPFVCGKQVARRTQAVSFADGVLRIEVPDTAWRAQLRELSADYLAGLNNYSSTRVDRVEFVLAGKPVPQEKKQQRPAATANRRAKPQGARNLGNTARAETEKASAGNSRKSNGGNKSKRK
jgi:predicted nucleic acid-binding Zn ribbon protein